MKNLDNPCSECVKTDNSCCTTDLVLNQADAILMMRYAKKLNKDVVLGPHIDNIDGSFSLMMVPNKPGIDIRREPCVFFGSNGKCEIYEDRPSICRLYGTQDMRCRYEFAGMKTEEEIAKVDRVKMRALDEAALDRTLGLLANMVQFKNEL